MATSLSKRPLDLVIVLWSVVHIPVTLLIDGQSGTHLGFAVCWIIVYNRCRKDGICAGTAFGADKVPGFAAKALEDYVQQYNDNVVSWV